MFIQLAGRMRSDQNGVCVFAYRQKCVCVSLLHIILHKGKRSDDDICFFAEREETELI